MIIIGLGDVKLAKAFKILRKETLEVLRDFLNKQDKIIWRTCLVPWQKKVSVGMTLI